MSKLVELWILDDSGEEVECPNCKYDVRLDILNKSFEIGKKFKWSRKMSLKCPCCKKFMGIEISWIPEYVKVRAIEV